MGGSGGTTLPLFTTAPSNLTLAAGKAQDYAISGGKAPYTAVSNNIAVVAAGVSGSVLTIGGVSAGAAEVSIRDSLGVSVTVSTTVNTGSTRALFTTAPSSITVTAGASGAQTYSVGGGASPYTATSSNAAVASVSLSNSSNSLTVTGLTGGTANIQVMDSLGAIVSISATVPTTPNLAFFTTSPSAITVAIGETAAFLVGGGTSPYFAPTTSNASVATATLTGNDLKIKGLAAGSASIVLRDTAGATLSVSVTVPAAATIPLFTTAPSSVTVGVNITAKYTVGGGTAPYTATSSNSLIAQATLPSGSTTLSIKGIAAGGPANVVIRDAAGATVNVAVTVASTSLPLFTTAPSPLNVAIDASPEYEIGGGKAPYTATSSNVSVLTAAVSDDTKLTLTGIKAGGPVTVVIRDALGATVNLSVTVPPNSSAAFFTTAPSAITLAIAGTRSFTVSGGTTPYFVSSANEGIATASVNGSGTLLITGVAAGTVTVVVRDSAAGVSTIVVTVSPTSTTPLATSAPSSVTIPARASVSYTISGGSGAGTYTATSSNTTVATVTVASSTLTIYGVKAGGPIPVVVQDSAGSSPVTINVTVSEPMTVNPSAATALIGDTLKILISGGTQPYSAQVTNTLVADASVSGNILTVLVKQQATAIPIIVTDANGAQATFTLTSSAGQTSIQLSPTALTISELSTTSFQLQVYGSVGTVNAFSSDTALLSTSVAGTVVTVSTGSQGNRCVSPATPGDSVVVTITAVDSTGAVASSVISIKDSVGACP